LLFQLVLQNPESFLINAKIILSFGHIGVHLSKLSFGGIKVLFIFGLNISQIGELFFPLSYFLLFFFVGLYLSCLLGLF